LLALSQTIEQNRKSYYDELARASLSNEISAWVLYFSETILEAQILSVAKVDFLVSKAKFFGRLSDALNSRQEKVILRIFREGLGGFEGGVSASNYRSISSASPATVTRDLDDLVRKGAFTKSGEKKGTRYRLNLDL
jgi:Fic family protein